MRRKRTAGLSPEATEPGESHASAMAGRSEILLAGPRMDARCGGDGRQSSDREADIGMRIRTLRRARGWTQERLAEICGVTRSAIAQWESGRAGQQAHNLAALADALSVSIDTLRYGGRLVNDPQLGDDERSLLSMFRHCSDQQKDCLMTVARTLTGVRPEIALAQLGLIVAPASGHRTQIGNGLPLGSPIEVDCRPIV